MKFSLRLIVSGIAALVAGGLFISQSYEKPLEGMPPTPMWKGIVAIGLGIALIGFGIRYLLSDLKSDSLATPPSDKTE